MAASNNLQMPSNWLSYSGAVQVSFYTTKQKTAIRLPTNQKPVADGNIVHSFILPQQEGEFPRRSL
jgi:hypothetical protein